MSDDLRAAIEALADECDRRMARSPDRVLKFWNQRLRAALYADEHRVVKALQHGAAWATCSCGAFHMGTEVLSVPEWVEQHLAART